MKSDKLSEMVGGWFIGDFEPTLCRTSEVEVAVKEYPEGAYEELHHHKVAIEFTVIVRGLVEMNGKIYGEGEILTIAAGEATDFRAIEATSTVVVKIPSEKNDKYNGNCD